MTAPQFQPTEPIEGIEFDPMVGHYNMTNGDPHLFRTLYDPSRGTCKTNIEDLHKLNKTLILQRGYAVDYTSDLEDLLIKFLEVYFVVKKDQVKALNIIACSIDTSTFDISRLDFMKCRDILSKILKRDKELGGKKGYTTLLTSIIKERNKYAHGRFFFRANDDIHVLQWIDKNNGERHVRYGNISEKQMKEYIAAVLNTYMWLNKMFQSISEDAS